MSADRSEGRKSVNLYIDRQVSSKAKDLAKAENRSLSNYVESLLKRELALSESRAAVPASS